MEDLHAAMAACEQTTGMNMLQHGHMVHDAYIALWEELNAATLYGEPELTRWFEVCGATENLPLAPEALRSYHVYHDCGKHLVLCTDEQGRRHFPDHARASASQYGALFAQDERTQYLIAHDMDFHTLRGDSLRAAWLRPWASTLYLTAWAEIRANASLFGGLSSESYKIKRSRLIQAAKKYVAPVPTSMFSPTSLN